MVITEQALPVKPYRLLSTPITMSVVGEMVRLVGAGANVLPSAMTYSTGVRKQVTLPVTGLDDHYVHEEGDAGTTCSGDSGGPTLIEVDGQEYVLGIHEAAAGTPACTGANYDSRIDLYASSFILPAVEKADPGYIQVDGGMSTTGAGGAAPGGAGGGGGGGTRPTNDKSSGCSFTPTPDSSWSGLLAIAGALLLSARRRRSAS